VDDLARKRSSRRELEERLEEYRQSLLSVSRALIYLVELLPEKQMYVPLETMQESQMDARIDFAVEGELVVVSVARAEDDATD
jgi:hypothetical protein